MGEEGFEPPAPWSQTKNHTSLDHSPFLKTILHLRGTI